MPPERAGIKSPLDLADFQVEPAHFVSMYLGSDVNWNLALLTAEYGGRQVKLQADSTGQLKVVDSAVVAALATAISHLSGIKNVLEAVRQPDPDRFLTEGY